MITEKMLEKFKLMYIHTRGYENARYDTDKRIILHMYLKHQPINKICKYVDLEEKTVQKIIDNAKKGRF